MYECARRKNDMGVTATTRLPAGWYPDPEGDNRRRWWDGQEWTRYTAEFQRPTSVDELELEPAAETSGKKPRKPARSSRKLRRVEDLPATEPAQSTEAAPSAEAAQSTRVLTVAERLGRWVAGAVHYAPSVKKRRAGKGRRAHRSAD